MCVEGGFFFKTSKRDFTFIREMRVQESTHWGKFVSEKKDFNQKNCENYGMSDFC